MPREEEDSEAEEEQPKRESTEQVPLGIRKPRSPQFDATHFADRQRFEDEEREVELLRKAGDEPLEAPDAHQDYEVRDGDETDRHLEGITSVNALKELIQQAKEEVENELEFKTKPFRPERIDELMVFTKEAVTSNGEVTGFAELKKHVRSLIIGDLRAAEEELERKKQAYLKSAGK